MENATPPQTGGTLTLAATPEGTLTPASTPEPESALAARLNVPRANFKRWRDAGQLMPDEHWQQEGNAIVITAAGIARVLELIGLETAPAPAVVKVAVIVQSHGSHARILRCKIVGGGLCSVRLMAPRVFASQFRRNDRLEVLPTENESIFEYDGTVPRRFRL